MEILKNVQLLDDSYLAEVSGGAGFGRAEGKKSAGEFFSTWYGCVVTGFAGAATIALSVLATIFLPKTPKAAATIASKGWFGQKAKTWGTTKLEGYESISETQQKTAADFHIAWADPSREEEIPAGLSVVANR